MEPLDQEGPDISPIRSQARLDGLDSAVPWENQGRDREADEISQRKSLMWLA